MMEKEIREKLSQYYHEMWSAAVLSVFEELGSGLMAQIGRIQEIAKTEYKNLSEMEKEGCRYEADIMIQIIKGE